MTCNGLLLILCPPKTRKAMKKQYFQFLLAIFFSLILIPAATTSLSAEEILMFAGAGLRQPLDSLIESFKKETGHTVCADYGGSGKQAVRIRTTGQGDLFMPGALFYIENLEKEGLAHDYIPVVAHTPVVGVHPESGNDITSFFDLTKPGIRIALGDPKAMAFGKTAMKILERSGRKEAILKNVIVYGATVKQLALYVAQGDVDAAIIGRADAVQSANKIRIVDIPKDFFHQEVIAVAILKKGLNRPQVIAFQKYLSGPEAVRVFLEYGFFAVNF